MEYEDVYFQCLIIEADAKEEEAVFVAQETTTGVSPRLPDYVFDGGFGITKKVTLF